jgi:hypothetical protein
VSFSARASNVWRAWSLRPCFIARTMLTWSFHLSQPQFTFSNSNHFIIDSDFFGAHTFRPASLRRWTSFDRVANHIFFQLTGYKKAKAPTSFPRARTSTSTGPDEVETSPPLLTTLRRKWCRLATENAFVYLVWNDMNRRAVVVVS